jgi:hypothetical protein
MSLSSERISQVLPVDNGLKTPYNENIKSSQRGVKAQNTQVTSASQVE